MKMIMLLMMIADGSPAATPDVQLLDFTASYCQPCQQMLPLLQRMEKDDFPIRRIDITEEHEVARRFNVDRVPTLVLLVEGKEVKRFLGLTDEAELRQEMNKAARKLSEARGEKAPSQTKPAATKSGDVVVKDIGNKAEAVSTEGTRSSIKDVFRTLLGSGANPTVFERPTVRGQSPEEDQSSLKGLAAATAATVRVQVSGKSTKDGKLVKDVGTGTIIYSETGRAIILTCAHVFLDLSTKDAVVEVEVYEAGKAVPYRGTLIGGDHNSDVALLKIQSAKTLPCVRLTSIPPTTTKGQGLISFGCNDGQDPTRLDTKLIDINRYDGPANLVCSTDPKSGRSGGGLFSSKGELVGVCSCADRKLHEGLYMAYPAILSLVQKLKLQSILMAVPSGGDDASQMFGDLQNGEIDLMNSAGSDSAVTKASLDRSAEIEPPSFDDSVSGLSEKSDRTNVALADTSKLSDAPPFVPGGSTAKSRTADRSDTAATANEESAQPEVTIIIDDKRPGSEKRVIVIPQASPWMMKLLTGEESDTKASSLTAALRPTTSTSTRNSQKSATRKPESVSRTQTP